MIYNTPKFVKFITFGFADAITLWPFGIFISHDNETVLRHEYIHWIQQKEMPVI